MASSAIPSRSHNVQPLQTISEPNNPCKIPTLVKIILFIPSLNYALESWKDKSTAQEMGLNKRITELQQKSTQSIPVDDLKEKYFMGLSDSFDYMKNHFPSSSPIGLVLQRYQNASEIHHIYNDLKKMSPKNFRYSMSISGAIAHQEAIVKRAKTQAYCLSHQVIPSFPTLRIFGVNYLHEDAKTFFDPFVIAVYNRDIKTVKENVNTASIEALKKSLILVSSFGDNEILNVLLENKKPLSYSHYLSAFRNAFLYNRSSVLKRLCEENTLIGLHDWENAIIPVCKWPSETTFTILLSSEYGRDYRYFSSIFLQLASRSQVVSGSRNNRIFILLLNHFSQSFPVDTLKSALSCSSNNRSIYMSIFLKIEERDPGFWLEYYF